MSSSARSGAANLVSVTSGTERERGFVGIAILPCVNLQPKCFFILTFMNKYFITYKNAVNIKLKNAHIGNVK